MPLALPPLPDLPRLGFDDIIDVRSPAEYAEDHMPGAISLPVLSNEERARVGTIYKQVDPFAARKVGAALVSRNAAAHIEGPLADRNGGWRPLVYCWRGGQRSGSFAVILNQIGWRAEVVEGGYRAYRRMVAAMLHDAPLPWSPVLIDGNTGTAKTRLLHHLAAQGAQVVDLEALAEHRGSLFGGLSGPQPAQKMFESRLAGALAGLDPARPVYLEAESNKIGDILIPGSLWKAMLGAPRIAVTAPLADRARHLIDTYAELTGDPAALSMIIDALRPYHAADQIADWQAQAKAREFSALAQGLMRDHYDPRYARSTARKAAVAAIVPLNDLSEGILRSAAAQILSIKGV
ncbi:tRNA 2-selenouridine synthase [Pseudooceanicola nitratireducens]|jgi:tRNA 2-selenouridine synthase|uniref:tRNA 2-selenouridine synthase n=1 Tax=Pseudooceanicola nitratireducens TaxID=517719 RepID=A0A1I1K7M2_9RHOB|nr:tRNA 2-selenouridine(34) synthase MnmH [Pseudooceanicola nitratireducens]SEJ47935.1 tRNA 2-selenouridine synthase [Pseudooceanicola nitratireducens]SFC56939.1 tRNA 2-selenouridine synthase [Pseudooceanicola nitratireducens]